MYKVNDKIIYKRDVCIIKEIKEKLFNNKDYYCISPIDDFSLIINVPIDSPILKNILTKEEALDIIEKISKVEPIKCDDKSLENIYKELLNTEETLDLVSIIKTTYLRNKKRVESGKKIGDKDDNYFKKAEKYLYNLLSVSLNMSYEECKEFIINKLDTKEGKHDD